MTVFTAIGRMSDMYDVQCDGDLDCDRRQHHVDGKLYRGECRRLIRRHRDLGDALRDGVGNRHRGTTGWN